MPVRLSSEAPVASSSSVVGEVFDRSVGGPLSEMPAGFWVTEAIHREFPDRDIPRAESAYGPLNPENEGWVWRDRIRAGELVVVVGEGASGKSTLVADWIARVTTGTPFPECDQALPPSDVLLFNAREDFARKVIPGIEAAGGDVDRVIRASHALLKHPQSPGIAPVRLQWANRLGPRVHLQEPEMMNALSEYLFDRPTIRMVVIDQANLHLRCGSERQFEAVMTGLVGLAHLCEVAVVITMQPDAFRRGEGVAKYLQSRSLKENVHAVWRLAPPTDPEVPGRVLECLKISHGVADSAKHHWHLIQREDQRLEWNRADGTELAPGKDLLKHRNLLRVREFLDQILFVLGGLAAWEVLVERGANQGIPRGLLREGLLYWNLPSLFEPHEGDLREIVGYPEPIAARKEELRVQQAAAREALRGGRSPFSVDLAAGVPWGGTAGVAAAAGPGGVRPPSEQPWKTSLEPASRPAPATPMPATLPGSASFIKPEVGAGADGGGEPELEGGTPPRNGVKTPATPRQKVAQAL
jgi:hypothetical protein